MVAKASFWVARFSVAALCVSTAGHAEDKTQIALEGALIRPPCTANFPTSQNVDIPKVNLHSLETDAAGWTDVILDFRCTKGSHVSMRFSAGNGTFDSSTLRTSLDKLGLKARFIDVTGIPIEKKVSWGELNTLPVKETVLKLKISVKPTRIGKDQPIIGIYRSTLLMEINYW